MDFCSLRRCFNFHPTGLFGYIFWKDNIFLNTARIGTGFILVNDVIINGDQSACVSDLCLIIAFLWRFVCQELEHIL